MTKNMSTVNSQVIDLLKAKVGVVKQLADTNATQVKVQGVELYFVNNLSSAVPMIYGIFVTQEVYIQAILREAGLPFKSHKTAPSSHRVFVTRNEYLQILSINGRDDVTDKADLSLKVLADSVLAAFPGASYICFEITTSDITSDQNDHGLAINHLSFDLEPHNSYPAHKLHQSTPISTILVDILLG